MIALEEILEIHRSPRNFNDFVSEDLDATQAYATAMFCPHEFRLANKEASLLTQIASASLLDINLSTIAFGANTIVDPGKLEDFYLYQSVVSGSLEVVSGEQRCLSKPGIATVISPSQETRMLWNRPARLLSLKIPKRLLEDHLTELLGQPMEEPLIFDLALNLTGNHFKPLQSSVESIFYFLRYGDWRLADKNVCRNLERWLLSALLNTQKHNYSCHLERSTDTSMPAPLRKTIKLLQSSSYDRITNAELAASVCVSERTLQNLFKQHLGKSIKKYRLNLILEKVRLNLVQNDHNRRLTDILVDAGVQHHGRFSGYYKEKYGELPSETLARISSK